MRDLSLECPRCGTRGRVRIDELDLQFRCKGCRAQFHVNSSGKCILGVSPRKQEGTFEAEKSQQRWLDDPFGPLIHFLEATPYHARLVLAALGFLSLAFLGYRWITGETEAPLPTSLEDRTTLVARAFVDNDLDSIMKVASPGTMRALKQWLEEERPDYWGADMRGDVVVVKTEIIYQNPKTGVACVVATMSRPLETASDVDAAAKPINAKSPPQAGTSTSLGIELLLYWVLDPAGQWVLDGDKILKGS